MSIELKSNSKKSANSNKDSKKSIFDFMNKDISFFRNKVSEKKKEQLYSSLYTLLNAGIDVSAVFQTIIEEQEKPKDKIIYEEIYGYLVKGLSLSQSFKKSNKFSEYEYYSIQIGEETGNLSEIFNELQIYFNQKIEQKRKLIGALTYPAVVLSVAFLVVVFMLNVIVPMFADVFKRFGGELPWLTQQVMNLSNFVNHNIIWILLSVVVFASLYVSQRKNKWFQKATDQLLLKTPVIGQLAHRIYLSRFCKMMALLIKADLPLVDSLELLSKMISFYPIEESVLRIKEGVIKGKTLYQAMAIEPIFTSKIKSLVKIGEEVNQLDIMFEKLSEQYNKEVDYNIQLFNSILEPLLIIFLAIVIGLILVAMYLPIFKLSSEIL